MDKHVERTRNLKLLLEYYFYLYTFHVKQSTCGTTFFWRSFWHKR